MTRVNREDGDGIHHHVIVRGVNRREIFLDDDDRRDFISRLHKQLIEGRGACLAWVLMPNHVHLVLRTGLRPLSHVMHRLNGGYARAFNARIGRCGYLFQDRFRSFLVGDDRYLMALVRYVHLNPVRAGLVRSVEELGRYPWSGYRELLGRSGPGLLAREDVLAFIEANGKVGCLEDWMRKGLTGIPNDEAVPNAPDREANRQSRWEPSGVPEPSDRENSARQLRLSGWTLEALIDAVCEAMGANSSALRSGRKSRNESQARAAIALLATRELGFSQLRVARATGVAPSSLSRAIPRGETVIRVHGLRLQEFEVEQKGN